MNSTPTPKVRIDNTHPQWQAMAQEIRAGSFTREGMFAAFPLCFPGVTVPIPADESRIVALDTDADGMVYGSTTGRANHVFFACFQATSGIVLDIKWPDPGERCAALCCGTKDTLFAANGATGARLLVRQRQNRPGDLLHEWGFAPLPFAEVDGGRFDAPILDLGSCTGRAYAVGATRTELFLFDFATRSIADRHAVPNAGRLCRLADAVYGFDGTDALWRYRPESRTLERRVVALPADFGDPTLARWCVDRAQRKAYLIDAAGRLFRLDATAGLVELARFPVTPVTAAGVTHDGRLFAFAGEGIARFVVFEPATGALRDLGTAVSILERRRYGYAFASATVGRDGEVFFGEDDDLAHLWLYFPSIPSAS